MGLLNATSLATIFRSLNDGSVRYLVAGGLAVVAHGYVRFTADVDLILDMDEENLTKATSIFTTLGYKPRAPVALDAFAKAENRRSWREEKGRTVFSLWSAGYPMTEIDLFVELPFDDFEAAFARGLRVEVAPGVKATMVGLEDLMELKRRAARPKDIEDMARLSALQERDHD